jgi:hypothetical protein
MTTLDHASHIIRRKAYAPHYTPSNVALFQPEMHDAMLELVKVIFSHSLVSFNTKRRFNQRPSSTWVVEHPWIALQCSVTYW